MSQELLVEPMCTAQSSWGIIKKQIKYRCLEPQYAETRRLKTVVTQAQLWTTRSLVCSTDRWQWLRRDYTRSLLCSTDRWQWLRRDYSGGLLSHVQTSLRNGRQNCRPDICGLSGEPATSELENCPHLHKFHLYRSDDRIFTFIGTSCRVWMQRCFLLCCHNFSVWSQQ
jgi:hypothetical protein